MDQKKSFTELVAGPVNLEDVLDRLTFSEETLPTAVLEQAALYMEAARFRIRKMRQRQSGELELEQARARKAIFLRATMQKIPGKRGMTETHLNQLLDANPMLNGLKKKIAEAGQIEEWAKSLQEALRMRRDCLKIYAGLLGTEMDMRIKDSDVGSLTRARQRLRNKMPETESL
jgi:hypothetical protein